ncbi:MAG TPA: sigma-70 family RNA polymerase sigma factor, partial [Xanthobacteraceae bacterium]
MQSKTATKERWDDAELVRRALARDSAAFRMIIETHNRRLYRIARSVLRNDSEAEDVVQETYVRAFANLVQFRGESSLSAWLGRIALNDALKRRRHERRVVEVEKLDVHRPEARVIP